MHVGGMQPALAMSNRLEQSASPLISPSQDIYTPAVWQTRMMGKLSAAPAEPHVRSAQMIPRQRAAQPTGGGGQSVDDPIMIDQVGRITQRSETTPYDRQRGPDRYIYISYKVLVEATPTLAVSSSDA